MPTNLTIGPLMIDIDGHKLTAEDRKLIQHPLTGGLILFSRNYSDPPQLQDLVSEIRETSPNIIIAVDHEGGRVQRFKEGFSHLPPMDTLGRRYASHPDQAVSTAKELGWLMASELLSYDIDISFAPVMDREYGVSQVIGDRAFSQSPDAIVALSEAFISGMHEAGMKSTGKHFPGHGYVAADSHIEIPVDSREEAEIMRDDMCVFAEMVKKGMDAVMPAHVIYPKVDSKPAGFSKYWVKTILRETLGFDGVVFSDDLSMEGATIAGSFSDRAKAALSAGCDMVLVCNNRDATLEVLDCLSELKPNDASTQRLTQLRGAAQFNSPQALQEEQRWKVANARVTSYKEKGESALWTS